MRALGIVVALVLAVPQASVAITLPHGGIVWDGTITTSAGLTGVFHARTRYVAGRDIDTKHIGRFRCRGPGCPGRRGRFEAFPGAASGIKHHIGTAELWSNPRFVCYILPGLPPLPDFRIEGQYQCSIRGVVGWATGTLKLQGIPRSARRFGVAGATP